MVFKGLVVVSKPGKTITVKVSRMVPHAKYGKMIKRSKKFLVHNEGFSVNVGDSVEFAESRRVSKNKCWKVLEVHNKA